MEEEAAEQEVGQEGDAGEEEGGEVHRVGVVAAVVAVAASYQESCAVWMRYLQCRWTRYQQCRWMRYQ
jgi:hypothetical protein